MKQIWLRRSYIGRHWRGEITLPVSFFINVYALPLSGLTFAVLIWVSTHNLILSSLLFLPFLFVPSWSFIGAWRSASSYARRGGRVFWAYAVKFILIASVIGAVIEVEDRHPGAGLSGLIINLILAMLNRLILGPGTKTAE